MKDTVLNPIQLNDGKANGIGPLGSPSGKKTPGFTVHEGNDLQFEVAAAVEIVEQDDVGESVEILQSCLVLFKYLDCAVNTGGPLGLNRHTFQLCERGVDNPDRF